jgi:hypothetical protein
MGNSKYLTYLLMAAFAAGVSTGITISIIVVWLVL